jgi:hypothetical protein
MAHFFAVATYGLQHPDSMNYTAQTLLGLYASVSDVLHRRATLDEIRARTRQAANGTTRVTRRAGDAAVPWRRGDWPVTVMDVLKVEAEQAAYAESVTSWACATVETLDGTPQLAAKSAG